MEAVGIVVEYNPFHKGHRLHIEALRKDFPEEVLIAVMSGDYVQRGEAALISKERRAKKAKEMGVDLVVELPAFYSSQSAEGFARASIGMLDLLGAKAFVFGSERNDLAFLEEMLAKTEEPERQARLRDYLQEGLSYPTAFSKAMEGERLLANDILGLEYLRALKFWNSSMEARSIQRVSSLYYGENEEEKIAGATKIRERILRGEEYRDYLCEAEEIQAPYLSWEKLYPYLRYQLLFHAKDLSDIQDMEKGLDQRLKKAAKTAEDYSSFLEAVQSKRYTRARLQRVFLHVLLDFRKNLAETWKAEIPFLRVLDYSEKGQLYMNQIKKQELPLITTKKNIKKRLSKKALEAFFWNERASEQYQWIVKETK